VRQQPVVTRRLLRFLIAAASVWLPLVSQALAPAQQIQPNYRDADIRQIVEAVGEVTGYNFLVDPRVRAQVTLLSFSPMTPEAFYEAFLAVLQVHGFVAMPAGDVIKIVPDANARQMPGPDLDGIGDQIVTQTVELKNIGAAQLVPILRPLIPQYGHLAAHPTSNILIISDRAANVQRMLSIIRRMDQAGSEDVEVIRLENASANEVVRMLGALIQTAQAAGGAPGVQLAADERTNSVLISGTESGRLRYRALVAHLDTPSSQGGDTHVRYLNYAEAEDLATKLQAQFGAGSGGAAADGGADSTPTSIWADAGTNALVIKAPALILQDMLAVVDRIDIRRAQVKVEAIIVEVRDNKEAELGVTWVLNGSDSNRGAGLTNFSSTTGGIIQLAGALDGSTTPDPGIIADGLTLGVGRIRDAGTSWAAILSALRGDANTNVISTPTILTMDNEEAEIRVGQEVPFLTGSFTNTGAAAGAVNPFQTIQRQEVGTRLKITPQINEGSGVKLMIEQETSSISQGASGAVDLITNTRNITTSVFVEDQQILVLGGLIDDQLTEVQQQVPLLGRVPGLGWLFRARRTERVKTNLMVFIRPTILRDSVQSTFETNQKYNELRQLQLERYDEKVPLLRGEQRPLLPDTAAFPMTPSTTTGTPDGRQP
jgi:general secretion pathway protein D